VTWTGIQAAIQAWAVAATGLPSAQIVWAGQGGGRPAGALISLRVLNTRLIGHDWRTVEDNPLVVADLEIEAVDDVADTVTITGHGLATGDGPLLVDTDGTRPDGLSAAAVYAIVVDDDTLQLAASATDAVNGVEIDILDAGTGTHTIVDTPDTVRVGEELIRRVRGHREAVLSVQAFAGPPGNDPSTGENSPLARLERMKAHLHFPGRNAALNAAGVGVSTVGPIQSLDGQLGQAVLEPRAAMEVRFFHTSEVTEFGSFVESVELTNQLTSEVSEISL
jgi:hypothetical protein